MKFSSHIEKQLIDNNLDSIVLTDREGNIEYVNKAAIHLFGYSIEELKGKPISIFEVPGKGVVAEVLAALDREGKWSGEVVRRRKDGSTFHASLSVLTINDEDGKIIGFAGNIKDISQRISITDALIEKQYQLKSIIDNTVDIIASIDKDLNLIEFNQVLTNLVKN
ncbi:MAG TPA: PAS domain S-box protein, partial [Bacteroidia bacterium]|nr:PAS domain S-box protein [Bacteroidia bacterium]